MTKARKTTLTLCCLFLSLLLAFACLLGVCAFALPTQYDQTYLGGMALKLERLKTTRHRVVVIGGSSVAFGLDSALFHEHMHKYNAVNFGLYGDLGTKLMMDVAIDHLEDGDVVVLSPEQESQTLSLYFNGEQTLQAADGCFELLTHVKSADRSAVCAALLPFAAQKVAYMWQGKPIPTTIYRRDSFNEFGDIRPDERPQNVMQGGVDGTKPVTYSPTAYARDFIEYCNDFARLATLKGARVFYRFCPVNASAVTADSDLEATYEFLRERLSFPILGDPHASVLPRGYFYDTNFHLNSAGVVVNTHRLIDDLKVALLDDSPTHIVDPTAPDLLAPELLDGDNSDVSAFTYERVDGGLRITGLSAWGKTQTALTLPFRCDGELVLELSANALQGATALKTLTVQRNIRALPDGLFRGCASLRTVRLCHESPQEIAVGDGLMDGASFAIAVAPELVNSFRIDYRWQAYAPYITGATAEGGAK